jgi:hypothetical protein
MQSTPQPVPDPPVPPAWATLDAVAWLRGVLAQWGEGDTEAA